MKYFLYANTEKKPIMRFFDHWFEVNDFLNLMEWQEKTIETPEIEIYKKIDDKDKETQ